jgi:hypothetical protein
MSKKIVSLAPTVKELNKRFVFPAVPATGTKERLNVELDPVFVTMICLIIVVVV